MTDQALPEVPSEGDAVVLARRPGATLQDGDLVLERRATRRAGPGEVVVHNVVTTVDPLQLQTLRGSTDIAAVGIGDPVAANSVGFVVQSRDPRAPVGTQVATYTGWQEYATTTLDPTEIADPALGDPLRWISLLGTTGLTAYVGMHEVGRVQPDHNVLVNAASGSVGGVAVQLAKAAGARVVAIAGGQDRVAHAVEALGADVAVDYRAADFPDRLTSAAGGGFDLFFDNVALAELPDERTPNRADWARLSEVWRTELDERISQLVELRDRLTDCIGCGCLSLEKCALSNPYDNLGEQGPGARRLRVDRRVTDPEGAQERAGGDRRHPADRHGEQDAQGCCPDGP